MNSKYILNELSSSVKEGNTTEVTKSIAKALDEGISVKQVLNEGLLAAMYEVTVLFEHDEVPISSVVLATRVMRIGLDNLKKHLHMDEISDLDFCKSHCTADVIYELRKRSFL